MHCNAIYRDSIVNSQAMAADDLATQRRQVISSYEIHLLVPEH